MPGRVQYLFNQLASRKTWADIYGNAQAISQYEKTNPLEVALFRDMLDQIPGYVVGNSGAWASVIVGFETYAKEQSQFALLAHGAEVQGALSGLRGFDPSSWIDRAMGVSDARGLAEFIGHSQETLMIVSAGPQVFNRNWYAQIFGAPERPWSAYYPGYQVLGPRKRK